MKLASLCSMIHTSKPDKLNKSNKSNKLSKEAKQYRPGTLLTLVLYSFSLIVFSSQASESKIKITEQQAKALTMLSEQAAKPYQVKTIRIELTKLSDNQGQVYLGGVVSRADLLPYLSQLKSHLKEKFEDYRANQAARDHQLFHMTLLSPNEYLLADKTMLATMFSSEGNNNVTPELTISLLGLGYVEKDDKSTFFVVAQSTDAQYIRQQLLLPNKDFHVTLGFKPSDIYGVKKDLSTLMEKLTQ